MDAKTKLHPRNLHKDGYDFDRLIADTPELKAFLTTNPVGRATIDFRDAQAVRVLNQALLKTYYGIGFWDIPADYLCPPIPGRVDYIHNLADLLASENNQEIPQGRRVKVLDIGTGANLVYPLLGQSLYGWSFTGVDIDSVAIKVAQSICQFNGVKIKLKQQKARENIFRGVIGSRDFYHLTMCNPPFHASAEAATKGTQRKWKNLGHGKSKQLNFGGKDAELWCPGGEIGFVTRMVEESVAFSDQCMWFSVLISKKENLKPLRQLLKTKRACAVKEVQMAQGQKISRFLAWSFLPTQQRRALFAQQ